LNDYVIVGPRSGFGMAIVQQGRVVDGAHHAPGEVGRWPWPPGEKGAQQDLHHALSASATWRRLSGLPADASLPADLRTALAAMPVPAPKLWQEVCRDFALVLSFSQLLLDTEVFILHGPLTVLGDRFCNAIVAEAIDMTPALTRETFRFVPSMLGDDAGALGAASLAMESWLPE
jgi:predicted NBD/HSP70 family sugar kinase